ncbi:MAG: porin family protein [Hyphomicrobiales bacterium]|nr:porin family protein [Hyphomicrobiales bacterium]
MKNIALGVSMLALLTSAASAADLPRRNVAPIFSAPIFTWTGFYLGAHAGYTWGKAQGRYSDGAAIAGSTSPGGFLGGLHAGYNWQTGALVLGVEGDVDYTRFKGSRALTYTATGLATGLTGKVAQDWQGSVRARVGYAIDNILLYGTGGLALTSVDTTLAGAGVSRTLTSSRMGWTLGAGAEFAFSHNWSTRVEYRYTDFGRKNATFNAVALVPVVGNVRLKEQAVTVGVSYKF